MLGNIYTEDTVSKELLKEQLEKKIGDLDIDSAKLDIRRFIDDDKKLDIWSREYFLLLVDRVKIINNLKT